MDTLTLCIKCQNGAYIEQEREYKETPAAVVRSLNPICNTILVPTLHDYTALDTDVVKLKICHDANVILMAQEGFTFNLSELNVNPFSDATIESTQPVILNPSWTPVGDITMTGGYFVL